MKKLKKTWNKLSKKFKGFFGRKPKGTNAARKWVQKNKKGIGITAGVLGAGGLIATAAYLAGDSDPDMDVTGNLSGSISRSGVALDAQVRRRHLVQRLKDDASIALSRLNPDATSAFAAMGTYQSDEQRTAIIQLVHCLEHLLALYKDAELQDFSAAVFRRYGQLLEVGLTPQEHFKSDSLMRSLIVLSEEPSSIDQLMSSLITAVELNEEGAPLTVVA